MFSGVFISALLLLGGSLVLGIYHLLLYFQYREKVILAYCFYLISASLYIGIYLMTHYIYNESPVSFLHYLKEVGSILTILGYTWFVFVALGEWHQQYRVFFRAVRLSIIALLGYCAFYIVAGVNGWAGTIITTVLPYMARITMFIIAFITVKLFFPKMNDRFLRLVKWGSVIYLLIVTLVVLAGTQPGNKLAGIQDMYLFFTGSFIDLVIFSMAMAYKVKSVLLDIMEVRSKISQDLHDDIGASLSSLQIYGDIAEKTISTNPAKAMEMVRKISDQSKLVMDNMSDIVWSMNPVGYGAATLEAKIKNFGTELLRDKNINLRYEIVPETESLIHEVQERKNILLVIKEALNNISKYSEATEASLRLYTSDRRIILEIKDNGTGFETSAPVTGNGLRNMQNRVNELGGNLEIVSDKTIGTMVRAILPVKRPH